MGRRRAQAGAERESPGAIGEVVNRAAEVTDATVASVPTERGVQPRTDAATSRIKESAASSIAPCKGSAEASADEAGARGEGRPEGADEVTGAAGLTPAA
ncbi:hypothetical protein V6N13_007811 [Hibiscus sabdariffa]